MVGAAETAEHSLGALPRDMEAVYVTLLPRMVASERELLFQGLAKRGVPSVSMWGIHDVELGAMGGLEPDTRSAVARRIAVNIHQLLQGVETDTLPVYLPIQDRLVINMASARETGWSPDYDLSIRASFLNLEAKLATRALTLQGAMERAASSSVEVEIAREEPRIMQQEALVTRGNLIPSMDLFSRFGNTRYTDISNPLMTPGYANQGLVGVQLRQLLYSDPVLSAWRAQKRATRSAEYQLESTRMDAILTAVGAYLDVLSARALRTIEKQNLAQTENNLSLAKLRVEIGAAEPSELHRWERDQARNRAALIQRDYEVRNAMIALNRAMGTSREQVWELDDIPLGDEDFFFLGDRLNFIVRNLSEFERFGAFLMQYSVLASPELASFDYGLIGQGILLRQKKRRFYLPDVALTASADRVTSRSSFQDLDGQNQMSVGIELSFPIFTGGARRAELKKQQAEIRKLSWQREQAVQQIEQNALSAKNNIGRAHPNILLNRVSLGAAENLYQSVLQKYSLGTTDYLTLLDAQQAQLVQRQQAALAVYQYLFEIHRLQRSIAWFEFEKSEKEKDEWIQLLVEFLESGGLPDRAYASLGVGQVLRGGAAAVATSVNESSNGNDE